MLPQIVQLLHFRLVDSLLHQAPDLVVNWIEVGAVGGHKYGEMKAGVSRSRSSHDEPGAPDHGPAKI